jgi:DNA-binding response OmpR family regulator
MKMALVEDDSLLRESLVLYFRAWGCTVDGYADGDAALEAFRKGIPDIVISDFCLPGRDGLTLLRWIGERRPGTLRILVTGHPSPDIARVVQQAGIDDLVLKPFSVEELEDALRRILDERQGRISETSGTAL